MSPLLQSGLHVTAIGMTVVFVLLTLLVGVIRGMSAISLRIQGADIQENAPGGSEQSAGSVSNQELVGVISAAIAAHRQRHKDHSEGN